jgi:NADPH:quinone reductase-like Zn-dependent oxidoreductase
MWGESRVVVLAAPRIRVHRRGGPEVLRYEDAELPAVGATEVLVEVHAAAVTSRSYVRRVLVAPLVLGPVAVLSIA